MSNYLDQDGISYYDGKIKLYMSNAISSAIAATYKPGGSLAFANLPSLDASHVGFIYNITDDFTTTADFVEGAGTFCKAGANVGIVNVGTNQNPVYKYDLFSAFVDLSNYATLADLPTKTSDLTNDSGFATAFTGTAAQWAALTDAQKAVFELVCITDDLGDSDNVTDMTVHKAQATVICSQEEGTTASKSFSVGDLIYRGNVLYKVTAAIASGDSFVVGTNIATTTIEAELAAVRTALADKVDKVNGKGLSTNDFDNTYKSYATIAYNLNRRTRNNITSNLTNLSTAVSEQNFAKYGYSIGDYFTGASGYTYILADCNTFKGTTTPYCISTNHIGIVVDTHATSQWHTENAAAVGYNGSTLHTYLKTTVLDNIKADFKALFGGSTGLEHLIAHNKLLTAATANWAWQSDQYISALTCTQVDAGSQWTANGFQEGEASKSLEVFRKYKWTEIFGGEYPWLRNISNYDNSSASFACLVDGVGSLLGYSSVAGSFFAVGLINFY